MQTLRRPNWPGHHSQCVDMLRLWSKGDDAKIMSRRRYRYDEELKQMVEIGDGWQPTHRFHGGATTEEIVYGHARATDGTPLHTRRRHREYMKQNGLAMHQDFTETLAKKRAEREKFFTEGPDSRDLHNDIGRTLYELRQRGRR